MASPVSSEQRCLVSVLVPVLNEARHLRAAIGAMLSQDVPEGLVEFIFADGGSTDGSRQILEEVAGRDVRVRVVDNPGRSIPRGLNVALAAARGAYIARMDAHTSYPRDYLQVGIRRLRRGTVGWVSGPQIAVGHDWISGLVALALSSPLGTGGATHRARPAEEVEVASGFTGVWRAEVLRRFGGWNEAWPINEDGELGARMREAGERILCLPEMAAEYSPRSTVHGLARQYFRYGQYKAKTILHRSAVMNIGHVMPPLLITTLAFAAGGPRHLRRAGRGGAAIYTGALALEALRLARRERTLSALAVPFVLAVMHVSWGSGALVGLARFGPSRPRSVQARKARA